MPLRHSKNGEKLQNDGGIEMIKIGLLSDTHSYLDDRIIHHLSDVDEIWHAGDIGNSIVSDTLASHKPFRAVYGNIDGSTIRSQYPEHLHFTIEGMKIWMTHIGGYPGRYTPAIKESIYLEKPDLFITGHSHILKVIRDPKCKDILHLNPGAAGKHGFHKMRTILKFNLLDKKIENLQAIELGART